jgi:hypothetical protein
MTEYRIQRVPEGGWWLYSKGVHNTTKHVVWWHVFHNKWFSVYRTLDDVFARLKEMKE